MREHCDVCGGLGVQVEVRPWNSAERVCEQGHRWFTSPVPGTGHGDSCPPLCECYRYYGGGLMPRRMLEITLPDRLILPELYADIRARGGTVHAVSVPREDEQPRVFDGPPCLSCDLTMDPIPEAGWICTNPECPG